MRYKWMNQLMDGWMDGWMNGSMGLWGVGGVRWVSKAAVTAAASILSVTNAWQWDDASHHAQR